MSTAFYGKIGLMNKFILFAVICISTLSSYSQSTTKKQSLKNNTVSEKFNYIYKKSNGYKEYKVVKKAWLHTLKKQVLDSIQVQKKEINNLSVVIENQNLKNQELNNTINGLNNTINTLNNEKDHVLFLGMGLKKGVFKTLFWSILFVVTALLLFFIYQFKRSNSITSIATKQLTELESEFETHRKNALEREQKVRRKLQDELNKNRS